MKKEYPTSRSFTLIEMLLSSVIVIIIIGAITSFFLNIVISKQDHLNRQELSYNIEFAIRQIQKTIRSSEAVLVESSSLGVHPGVLGLQVSNPLNNPTLIASLGSDLSLQKGMGLPESLITDKVSLVHLIFNFSNPNNTKGTLTGTLTLRSNVDSSLQRTETFTINVR